MRFLPVVFLLCCTLCVGAKGQESTRIVLPASFHQFRIGDGDEVPRLTNVGGLMHYRWSVRSDGRAIADGLSWFTDKDKYRMLSDLSPEQKAQVALATYRHRKVYYETGKDTSDQILQSYENIIKLAVGPLRLDAAVMAKGFADVFSSLAGPPELRPKGDPLSYHESPDLADFDGLANAMLFNETLRDSTLAYITTGAINLLGKPEHFLLPVDRLSDEYPQWAANTLPNLRSELALSHQKEHETEMLLSELEQRQAEGKEVGAEVDELKEKLDAIQKQNRVILKKFDAAIAGLIRNKPDDIESLRVTFNSASGFARELAVFTRDPEVAKYAEISAKLAQACKLISQADKLMDQGGLLASSAAIGDYATVGLIAINLIHGVESGPTAQEMIAEMFEYMQARFDELSTKLDGLQGSVDHLLTVVVRNFHAIGEQLDEIERTGKANRASITFVQNSLNELRYELKLHASHLEEMVAEGFRREFYNSLAQYVFKYDYFDGQMNEEQFQKGMMLFHAYATQHSADAVDLGPKRFSQAELSNLGVLDWLVRGDAYKHADNFLSLIDRRSDLGYATPPQLTATGRVNNLNTWYASCEAILTLVDRNPQFSSSIRPDFFEHLLQSGRQIQDSLDSACQRHTLHQLICNYIKQHRDCSNHFEILINKFRQSELNGLAVEGPTQVSFTDRGYAGPLPDKIRVLPDFQQRIPFVPDEFDDFVDLEAKEFPSPRKGVFAPKAVSLYQWLAKDYHDAEPIWSAYAKWRNFRGEFNGRWTSPTNVQRVVQVRGKLSSKNKIPDGKVVFPEPIQFGQVREKEWQGEIEFSPDWSKIIHDGKEFSLNGWRKSRLNWKVTGEPYVGITCWLDVITPSQGDEKPKAYRQKMFGVVGSGDRSIVLDLTVVGEAQRTPNGLTIPISDDSVRYNIFTGYYDHHWERDLIQNAHLTSQGRFDSDGDLATAIEWLRDKRSGQFKNEVWAVAMSGPEMAIGKPVRLDREAGLAFAGTFRGLEGAKLLMRRYVELCRPLPSSETGDALPELSLRQPASLSDMIDAINGLFDQQMAAAASYPENTVETSSVVSTDGCCETGTGSPPSNRLFAVLNDSLDSESCERLEGKLLEELLNRAFEDKVQSRASLPWTYYAMMRRLDETQAILTERRVWGESAQARSGTNDTTSSR